VYSLLVKPESNTGATFGTGYSHFRAWKCYQSIRWARSVLRKFLSYICEHHLVLLLAVSSVVEPKIFFTYRCGSRFARIRNDLVAWIWIRPEMRIRNQVGKNERKKFTNALFWSAGCSLFRTGENMRKFFPIVKF
jgi:hypothetical protein